MPRKRKRLGRPPGSKNIKSKKAEETVIKTENDADECNEQTNICTYCSRTFESRIYLLRHIKYCSKPLTMPDVGKPIKSTFTCNQCHKKFRFKKSYTNHLRDEHSNAPGSIACSQCSVVCPNKEILTKHIENIHQREIFECEHCGKKFVRRSHVLRHMMQRGCDGRNVSVFPCEICDATFSRKDNLMVHLRMQHIASKFFSCKLCDFQTRNFSKLIVHHQCKHIEIPQYECDHCGKITSSRGAIAKHLEIHGEKKYACDVCGYSTFTIEVMRRHVFTHVPEKPYKCNICKRSYIQKVQLQRHMEKHNGSTCTKCGLSFQSKARLLIHEREHMGLTKLLCPIETCVYSKKEFSNEESLQSHVKMHLDEKPYECEVCPKRFHSDANMRRHMSTHALERPRRCMYCVAARAYVRGEQLVRHVRKSHPQVFRERLLHVRRVLGSNLGMDRVRKSELESILNVLDAESDRILEGYGQGVLYGGLQEQTQSEMEDEQIQEEEDSPLMSEEELAESLKKLLSQLIDNEMLECFGWPDESVDVVLEKVIENCGARAADRDKWTRVQRLRENAKHLFLYVIEDKNIARMLDTHTIDQIINHILDQVSKPDDSDNEDDKSKKMRK
ncbi:zinc finger protein 260-like [Vanessa tameamea]|uniref:Zinc finger protein 260-like n=1 Tax=Vanessa tameamea TaxID=334116 RepID=A0A8B8IDL8_VANTA|nr:zinc finger protein 260-like [Vanessa tameamea]